MSAEDVQHNLDMHEMHHPTDSALEREVAALRDEVRELRHDLSSLSTQYRVHGHETSQIGRMPGIGDVQVGAPR